MEMGQEDKFYIKNDEIGNIFTWQCDYAWRLGW
jgi:hypothetical protein